MGQDSLRALGEQYAAEADKLSEMIKACKERRRFAIGRGNAAEAQRLERLAELHNQQRSDLLRLSAWLRHYYDTSPEENLEQKRRSAHADYYGCIA
ncbi:MAG: hypothetical protein LBB50_00895 [Oscillospiraceae bacterium]|jgi:hypothetical protein|nr:hypothetical protein [Oscillospiraceae bacterium]